MKKIVAIVLTMLMLLTSAALAETAGTLTLKDPVFRATFDGETQVVDLAGAELRFALGMAGDYPAIQADVTADGKALLGAVMQFEGARALFTMDGMSNVYSVPVQNGAQAKEGLTTLIAAILSGEDMEIPMFTGVTIPKLPLGDLIGSIGIATDTQVNEAGVPKTTFEVPYETINQMLNMVPMLIGSMGDQLPVDASQVNDVIQQIQEAKAGIAIRGSVEDDGTTAVLSADIYLVSDGMTADESAVTIQFSSAENNLQLDVLANDAGSASTLGSLIVTSDPGAARLSADVIVPSAFSFNGSLYPEDGLQKLDLDLEADGESISLGLRYGEQNGENVVDVTLGIPDAGSFALEIRTTDDGQGGSVGTLEMSMEMDGESINIHGDIVSGNAEVEMRSIDGTNAIPLDESSDQFNEDLSIATSAVMEYLNSFEPQAA